MCKYCKDKTRFGGSNTLRKKCAKRICTGNPVLGNEINVHLTLVHKCIMLYVLSPTSGQSAKCVYCGRNFSNLALRNHQVHGI